MPWLNYILSVEFLRLFRLLLMMVFIHTTPTCGKAITCTAGDFPVGANASLVCYFPDDIDAHDSVFVQYYPFSAPTDASDVLLCKAEDVKASKCNEQDGYVLKSHTRNTLSIVIVNINEKAAGSYTCQFLPPDKSPREMCNLTVHAKTTAVFPMEVDDSHPGDSQNSSTRNTQSGEAGTVSVGTLVGVIVAFLVVAAVIICIIIVVIVFRRCRKRSLERPVEKRSIDTQVSVDRALAVSLINTQSNGNKAPATRSAKKRSIQTQVSVDRALAAPL